MAYSGGGGYWGELISAPVNSQFCEGVTVLRFDQQHELLWAGTENGRITTFMLPSMERYSYWQHHASSVLDMVSVGEFYLSVSEETALLSSNGGAARFSFSAAPAIWGSIKLQPLSSPEPGQGVSRALLGTSSGSMASLDLATGKLLPTKAEVAKDDPIARICAPVGRGYAVVGTTSGKILLTDPRTRMKHTVIDSYIKVFDVRTTLRPLLTIPFTAGPSTLAFHPTFSSTLLVSSATGMFSMMDVGSTGVNPFNQVDCTDGGQLQTCQISGTASVYLEEDDSFANVPVYNSYHFGGAPISDEKGNVISVGLAPRLVSEDLLKDQKQACLFGYYKKLSISSALKLVSKDLLKDQKLVDFVGYIQNPKFARGKALGQASREVASLRSARVSMKDYAPPDLAAIKAERTRKRVAEGGEVLPGRYRHVAIKTQSDTYFEEFDFSFYNRTTFAGLENDLPNCYCNSLLQVLYFTPVFRDAVLSHVPEPDSEFCLTCELSFLFRMLMASHGRPCQASNLLRALRHTRESAALGLLDGLSSPPEIVVTQCLGGDKKSRTREHLRFQVELKYPASSEKVAKDAADADRLGFTPKSHASASITVGGQAGKMEGGSTGPSPGPSQLPSPKVGQGNNPFADVRDKPSFADVLQASLVAESTTRAWFDESHGYQIVRQARVQLQLPKVLTVNCALGQASDALWWEPAAVESKSTTASVTKASETKSKLPETKAETKGKGRGKDKGPGKGGGKGNAPPATDKETKDKGTEKAAKGGGSAQLLGSVIEAGEECRSAELPAGQKKVYELCSAVFHIRDADEEEERHGKKTYEGHMVALVKVSHEQWGEASQKGSFTLSGSFSSPVMRGGRKPSNNNTPADQALFGDLGEGLLHNLPDNLDDIFSAAPDDPAGGAESKKPEDQRAGSASQLKEQHEEVCNGQWVLLNDFYISPCPVFEVKQTFQGQKLPALLYYSEVTPEDQREAEGTPGSVKGTPTASPQHLLSQPPLLSATSPKLPSKPSISKSVPHPVMTAHEFEKLCQSPPLQGSQANLLPLRFKPLNISIQAPSRGMLFAIDAEFVAVAAPEKNFKGPTDKQTTQMSRLTLARVSVLRGEGPSSGVCCIDDYVCSMEPVFDHLTRYSGLLPGDLEPATSRHYLTTSKHTYMKLRYLLDAGVIFVGHGLKQDFRMINLVVPPEQVVDTVELFSLPRQRKMSLRFLASYLLGLSIQDAKTALGLYEVYLKLVADGTFQDKLKEIYRWGKMYGWEPVTLNKDGNPIMPQKTSAT
eukprot:gene4951-34729_t